MSTNTALIVAFVTCACTVPVEYECETDPNPVDLCTDLHEEIADDRAQWACLALDCGITPEFSDGWSRLQFLATNQIDLAHM